MPTIDFRELARGDKPVLDEWFRAGEYENSHFNFTTLYIWRRMYDPHWCVAGGVLLLAARRGGTTMMLQPIGPRDRMPAAVRLQADWMRDQGRPFLAIGIERWMAGVYTDTMPGLAATTSRDESDYVYRTADLIDLPGRRYHAKKNHLNSFRRDYPEAEYLPIAEGIIDECKLNLNGWYKELQAEMPDDPYIGVERAGVMEILSDFPYFGLTGGALRVGRRIAAFTFGERLNRSTAVVHVEKAAQDVRGAYAAINQAYLAREWQGTPFVNRQEDMGLEGLRRAKESYRPVRMVDKYVIAPAPAEGGCSHG